MMRLGALASVFSEATLAAGVLVLGLALAIKMTPAPSLERSHPRSQLVRSSTDEILWGFLSPDEKWRLSVSTANVDQGYIDALIAYEDKRFWDHRGVDIVALARAGYQAVRYGRSVSGGSTLTMQVVRLLEPRPRTFDAKIAQLLKALGLERALSKRQILDLYLTLAPFGGNVEGVRAASLLYLGKEPKRLSPSEAALFIALPQAPEARRPDRHPEAARAAKNRVLEALAARGVIASQPAELARRDVAAGSWHELTRSAPHLGTRLRAAGGFSETIETLIDRELQLHAERIVARSAASWGEAVSVAIVVLRNRDASVAAYVGGANYSTESRKSFVDLAQGVRSPGSTLKPFIYGLAFEKLIVHPETIITDQSVEIEGYRPENADGQFAGDLSVRQALIRSRNTTAVMLLEKVGVDVFLARFRSTGRPLHLPASRNAPGLAVGLGGVGVTLEQLTWFYTTFANEGELKTPRFVRGDPARSLGQFMSPAAARAIADILADVPAPPGYARQSAGDAGRRLGFKTGTSYGFRDAWAIGFDQYHTVGVWVGRADGAAHLGAYGVTAAAPLMFQIFDHLPIPPHDVAAGASELGALASARELPARLSRFTRSGVAQSGPPLEISFPRSGGSVRGQRTRDDKIELPLAVTGGVPPYQWVLSGVPQPLTPLATARWMLQGRGQFEISVMDSVGTTATSSFWVD